MLPTLRPCRRPKALYVLCSSGDVAELGETNPIRYGVCCARAACIDPKTRDPEERAARTRLRREPEHHARRIETNGRVATTRRRGDRIAVMSAYGTDRGTSRLPALRGQADVERLPE